MNEQLQTALAAAINKAGQGVEAGVSFLQSELPDVINQLLTWKLVSSLIYMGTTIAAILVATVLLKKGFQLAARQRNEEDGRIGHDSGFWLTFWVGVATFVVALILLAMVLNSFKWLQILIAPKLYLIEYAASLAK